MKRGLRHLQILLIIVICKLNLLREMALKPQHQMVHPELKLTEMMVVQVTVWKFQDFSITQILREIDFGDSRSAKYVILKHI